MPPTSVDSEAQVECSVPPKPTEAEVSSQESTTAVPPSEDSPVDTQPLGSVECMEVHKPWPTPPLPWVDSKAVTQLLVDTAASTLPPLADMVVASTVCSP